MKANTENSLKIRAKERVSSPRVRLEAHHSTVCGGLIQFGIHRMIAGMFILGVLALWRDAVVGLVCVNHEREKTSASEILKVSREP